MVLLKKNLHFIFRCLLLCLLSACGKDSAEKIEDAIVEAKFFLTKSECQNAINVLEDIGRQPYNPEYLQTLSSAYACRAGFGEINFFSNDIPLIGTTNGQFFNGLAKFSTSPMTSSSSSSFTDLQTAINILLYAGNITTPSSTGRANYFIKKDRDNINVQALYMMVAQLGKYARYYGNANSSTGKKGGGSYGNNCYVGYTNATAMACAAALGTDACSAAYTGHPDMSGTNFIKRMCYSVVLINNLIDILAAVTLSTGSTIGNLSSVLSNVQTAYNTVCTTYPTLCALRSQTDCEAMTQANLEIFMACVVETLHE